MKRLLFSLFFINSANAQTGNYFITSFGSNTFSGNGVYQLSSGSIYAAGSADMGVIGGRDFFLAKFDADGNWLWTEYYGTTDEDYCNRMIFNGSFFVLAGQTSDASASNVDGLMIAIDTAGSQLWMHPYGVAELNESLSGLSSAIDGGFIASGFKSDSTSFGHNFWLIKTDSSGLFQWEKVYGDTGVNEVSDAALQLSNGDILFSGDKQVGPSAYNAWMLKTDSAGNYKWDLLMANPHNGGCKNLLLDSMNNILVIGESATDSSFNFDIQVSKADTSGNLIWLKYIRASNESDAGFSIVNAPNGDYMLTGYYYDTVSSRKLIPMILLDSAGNELNRKLFGSSSINIGYQIVRSVYGGYIICGTDFQSGAMVLIYDNAETLNNISSLSENSFSIYPNPAHNILNVECNASAPLSMTELIIYDVTGRMVYKQQIHCPVSTVNCPLNSGMYFVTITQDGAIHTAKLIIE